MEHDKPVWAIELKASSNVGVTDLRGLKRFADFYGKPCEKVVAYLGDIPKRIEDVSVLPWQKVLLEMGL